MAIPSLTLTAILTVSSSRQRPHGDMGSANSQSPLCGDDAARNEVLLLLLVVVVAVLVVVVVVVVGGGGG